jgi:hypothetical protein
MKQQQIRRSESYRVHQLRSWRGVLDTTLCDKVRQLFATGRWFSPGTPVSSTNKGDCYQVRITILAYALTASRRSMSRFYK